MGCLFVFVCVFFPYVFSILLLFSFRENQVFGVGIDFSKRKPVLRNVVLFVRSCEESSGQGIAK